MGPGPFARAGVEVLLFWDALGGRTISRSDTAELRAAGGKVAVFFASRVPLINLRVNNRTHRKLLVVDGEVAFVGGVNLAAQWAPLGQGANWRDDVLRIEGPAVHHLERRFVATWRLAFQERFRHWERRLRLRRPAPAGCVHWVF